MLKSNPIECVLEEDNPSVRYFTLVDILGKLENKSEVKKTKLEIMQLSVVHKILSVIEHAITL